MEQLTKPEVAIEQYHVCETKFRYYLIMSDERIVNINYEEFRDWRKIAEHFITIQRGCRRYKFYTL